MTWASEKFQDFVLGKEFTIETDHELLVPLLNSKNFDNYRQEFCGLTETSTFQLPG